VTDLQVFAVGHAAILCAVFVWRRRVILTWSAIGVFMITQALIVQMGLLALPFLWEFAAGAFSLNLNLVDEAAVRLAIVLNVWGTFIVLATYHATYALLNRGRIPRRAPDLLILSDKRNLGFRVDRVLFISMLALAAVVLLVGPSGGVGVLTGIREGFLEGDHTAIVAARQLVGSEYMLVLVSFNVLPFLGVALWLAYKLRKGRALGAFTIAFCALTITLLLLSFQKRPVLVFLWGLLLASFGVSRRRAESAHRESLRVATNARSGWRLTAYAGLTFFVLMGLYFLQSSISREDIDPVTTAGILVRSTLITLFGGLSLPTVLYAQYFPNIEPHYGLRPVGVFSALFNFDLYPSSILVFDHFTREVVTGSVSVGTLSDFHGAFGIIGWLVGAVLLGVALNQSDRAVARLRSNAGRTLIAIFLFVTVYYLANAPIQNALGGYGGLIFVLLWVGLTVRMRPGRRSDLLSTTGPGAGQTRS
jgi:hypothetical protein